MPRAAHGDQAHNETRDDAKVDAAPAHGPQERGIGGDARTQSPHAAIGEQLYLIDVASYARCFDEDGNFSVEQLSRLSDSAPESIPYLLEKWPHVVNAREKETGDTVLHYCARERKFDALEKWLSGKEPFSQVENKQQRSALREVVDTLHFKAVPEMLRRLDPDIPLGEAPKGHGSVTVSPWTTADGAGPETVLPTDPVDQWKN